jgi:cell division protein FtsI/penicillin-binding protein 2
MASRAPARSLLTAGRRARRRHGRGRRLLPLAGLAGFALVAGLATGARQDDEATRLTSRYTAAWTRGDYRAMHGMLTRGARERTPLDRFERAHRRAAETATLTRLRRARGVRREDDTVVAPMRAETRIFGTVRAPARLAVSEDGGRLAIAWSPAMAFPGLRDGERLSRRTALPRRAALLARDGTTLARGTKRPTSAGQAHAALVGTLGSVPRERAQELAALGVPSGARVGLTGLERWLDRRLTGRPGGELRAGRRTLAATRPVAASDVRTSVDLDIQRAADTALAGRLGGVVALRPATGELLAMAGIGASAPQPPGSTFKIVTLAGALEAGIVRRNERFDVATAATLEGVELQNANGEACGGTLRQSFAESCNSVFGPLGAELGAARLVQTARAFGFNEAPPLPGMAPSTLPPAEEIGDDLAVGSTAIGQGRVLATTVQMAWIAATIANGGERVGLTAEARRTGARRRVIGAGVAGFVDRAMRSVVREGTGASAAIEGISVAGKTGTAELRTTQPPARETQSGDQAPPPPADTTDTNAWFTAFAPASRPRVAVAVMLVGQGAGGDTAAPAAKGVLEAGIRWR